MRRQLIAADQPNADNRVVPFGTCRWVSRQPLIDFNEVPSPELRHEREKSFVLLKSFAYLVPNEDPAAGTIIVVPGADAPASRQVPDLGSERVVVPPHQGGRTDLASVPSFMWWLVASYGNHTRAALLHDALVVDENGAPPPFPRTKADRLLLSALREPGPQKGGAFRHWLMWAAASVFGTMRRPLWLRPAGLVVHVFATWGLLIAALLWMWPELRPNTWWKVALVLAVLPPFLVVIGTSWRAGANLTTGWLPTALMAAPVAVLIAIAGSGVAFWLLLGVLALVLFGHVWGLAVDRMLRWRLWPTALVGLPIAAIPVGLIFLSILLVWFVDLGASIAASFSEERGRRRGFELPGLETDRNRF
jgi:Protein of unknown function (DUF1353)